MTDLHLRRPLVVFDLETTGISISSDRIVELAYIKLFPGGDQETREMRFNPGIPIPKEASLIHGIYDEDVKDCPLFAEKAQSLAEQFKGCDFAGFNSNKFDFPMLVEEFLRAGKEFETSGRKFVDAQRIYHIMEQRTLKAAYKFYCDKDLVDAHHAGADTKATLEVLIAQINRYPELKNDVDFLHEFSGQANLIDFAGRLMLNEKKEAIFNFGKHKGKTVEFVFAKEPGYYQWMMDSDFSLNTKRELTRLYIQFKAK